MLGRRSKVNKLKTGSSDKKIIEKKLEASWRKNKGELLVMPPFTKIIKPKNHSPWNSATIQVFLVKKAPEKATKNLTIPRLIKNATLFASSQLSIRRNLCSQTKVYTINYQSQKGQSKRNWRKNRSKRSNHTTRNSWRKDCRRRERK